MIRAVFFDAGHTLLCAHPDLGTIYAETTARFGVRLPPDRFAEAFRPVFREAVKTHASDGGASDAQDHAMWKEITGRIHGRLPELRGVEFSGWFEALYRRFGETSAWRLYDDVAPVLGRLRARGLALGVVSNWDTRLRGICAGLGLDRMVDFIVISAEAGVRKPDPRIFRMALQRAGVQAEEAAHVGDLAEEDGAGARRADMRAYLIDRRSGTAGPAGDFPVLRSLGEIEALI